MLCYKNIEQLITLKSAHAKDGRSLAPEDLSIINNAAMIFDDQKILWIGPTGKIPKNLSEVKSINLKGHIVLPGLVDSHTHIVFAGDRSFEYSMRLNGATYEKIHKAGGGILETTRKTAKASDEEILELSRNRIKESIKNGIKILEIKSGYGLSYEQEYRMSLLIDTLKKEFKDQIQIFNTFMAAHAVPKEFKNPDDYLKEVVIPLLKELAKLKIIDAVDIFHEKNYFETKHVNKLFKLTTELGIPKKIHADELNDNDGAALAVKHKCLSADHLLKINSEGIKKIAKSKTVATLLPGTALFLGKPLPKARKILDAGGKVAIASDFNPGSCHFNNLLLLTQLTAKSLKLNTAELVSSITLNAAASLGLENTGALIEGFRPIFSTFRCPSLDKLLYSWNESFLVKNPK